MTTMLNAMRGVIATGGAEPSDTGLWRISNGDLHWHDDDRLFAVRVSEFVLDDSGNRWIRVDARRLAADPDATSAMLPIAQVLLDDEEGFAVAFRALFAGTLVAWQRRFERRLQNAPGPTEQRDAVSAAAQS